MTKSGTTCADMTNEQIAKARERFREEVKVLRLSQFPDVAAATIAWERGFADAVRLATDDMRAWERGFADAVRLATDDMREMRVNLERRQAYDGRRE